MDLFTVDISPENLLKTRGLYSHVEKTALEKKKVKVYHNH